MKEKSELDKLKDDVHYLIVAHCKYKDISMYERALKQFQKDIGYGQLEDMSYDERFAFLLGFKTSLKAIDNAIQMHEWVKKNPEMVEALLSSLPQHVEQCGLMSAT
nr:MAG TPA: hypothetical protein [Caudoviricetes sp.]